MLAIIRQLPNHVSILAIIGVEILDARKRRLCDVGVISTDAEKTPGRERPLQERPITRPTKSKPISECQPLRSGGKKQKLNVDTYRLVCILEH